MEKYSWWCLPTIINISQVMKVVNIRERTLYAAKVYTKDKFENHQNKSRFIVTNFKLLF